MKTNRDACLIEDMKFKLNDTTMTGVKIYVDGDDLIFAIEIKKKSLDVSCEKVVIIKRKLK